MNRNVERTRGSSCRSSLWLIPLLNPFTMTHVKQWLAGDVRCKCVTGSTGSWGFISRRSEHPGGTTRKPRSQARSRSKGGERRSLRCVRRGRLQIRVNLQSGLFHLLAATAAGAAAPTEPAAHTATVTRDWSPEETPAILEQCYRGQQWAQKLLVQKTKKITFFLVSFPHLKKDMTCFHTKERRLYPAHQIILLSLYWHEDFIQRCTSPTEPEEFIFKGVQFFVFPHTFIHVLLLVGDSCRPTQKPNQARTTWVQV